jgi:hypothetical protein
MGSCHGLDAEHTRHSPDLCGRRRACAERLFERVDGRLHARRLRKRKASATDLAGVVTRTGTPSTSRSSTPAVRASPEQR